MFLGTENAADEESRQKIAVEKETGGSYVVKNLFFYFNSIYEAFLSISTLIWTYLSGQSIWHA